MVTVLREVHVLLRFLIFVTFVNLFESSFWDIILFSFEAFDCIWTILGSFASLYKSHKI